MARIRIGPTLSAARRLLVQTARDWSEDKVPQIGAALAYYTTISLAPILVVAVGLAGFFFGREAASEQLVAQLHGLLGPIGADAAAAILANSGSPAKGAVATVVGIGAVIAGSTTVFVQLQAALNAIWDVETPKRAPWLTLVKVRAVSFALVLGLGFLLLVSLALSAVLTAIGARFGAMASLGTVGLSIANTGLSIAVITLMFAVLFKFLPDVRIAWSDVWIGALVTSVLFNVGKSLIGIYLGNSSVGSAYGTAGSLVVLLVWVYYSAQLVLFGAEFTRVWAHRHGSHSARAGADAVTTQPTLG